jgi:hypothetical protein
MDIAVIGGRPAFQASIEVGPTFVGKRHGIASSHEWGVEADDRGSRGVAAMNLDVIQNDPDEGPIARLGVRMRGTVTGEHRWQPGAFLLRSAAFVGLARDAERRTAGLGFELAGGVNLLPTTQPIFEANLVIGGKFTKGAFTD